jgi:GNAT superfamily N-acetyltransferase
MSRYSGFEFEGKKTRVEESLEKQLGEMKHYRNASQNFENLDGASKDQLYFGLENNVNDKLEELPKSFHNDPRYNQSNSRDVSRKQINNKKNMTLQSNLPGLDQYSSHGSFEETNYEDNKFQNLNRNLELSSIGTNPLVRGFGMHDLPNNKKEKEMIEIDSEELNYQSSKSKSRSSQEHQSSKIPIKQPLKQPLKQPSKQPSKQSSKQPSKGNDLLNIMNKMKNKSKSKYSDEDESPVREEKSSKPKTNDLTNIMRKIKGIVPEEEQKPVIRMPNKKIYADIVKGKIVQFKNCPTDVQIMIGHALINEWREDFVLKKIQTYQGVINFILHNFVDKNNSFFVLFDDDNDFVATFAVDTENFAPYISHIYVNPNLRNKGFGKKVVKLAEKYIKKLGFDSSNLWCNEDLIIFYKKLGYNIDSPMRISETKTVWKLIKNLH